MSAARETYTVAALALYDTERKIENLTRWNHPSPDSINGKVLASLEARRDREAIALIPLKIAADAETATTQPRFGSDIRFPKREWQPIGTIKIDDSDLGDIPAFLRRVPV